MSVAQAGSGDARDLVVIAHGGLTPAITAAAPAACVVSFSFPPFKQNYRLVASGGMLPPLADVVKSAQQQAKFSSLRNLVLVGFSEGCQAVRAYLAAGEVPSAILAIDGAHASQPPAASQIDPWRSFIARSRAAQGPISVVTATRIPTSGYLPTSTVLLYITGLPPAPREPDAVWEQGQGYLYASDGLLLAEQWPGTDAAAHIQQAREVLPRQLGRVVQALGGAPSPPWVKGLSPGSPPAAPVGVVWPKVPGLVGGGGSSSPPSSTPPSSTPPSSKPPSYQGPPPAPASSRSEAGAVAAFLLMGGLAAVLKR